MKTDTPARAICTGGILTALIFLLQSAPVWLPGAGLFLSPFATLPAALAAALSIPLGTVVYIAAAFLLLLFSPQEAAIFLLATGLVGLTTGIALKQETPNRVLIPAAALFFGLLALTRLALIPVFGGATPRSVWVELLLLIPFSFLYAVLWMSITRHAVFLLDRIPIRHHSTE